MIFIPKQYLIRNQEGLYYCGTRGAYSWIEGTKIATVWSNLHLATQTLEGLPGAYIVVFEAREVGP